MEDKYDKIIAIPLEEYKELLIIKGKYEEYSNSRLQTLDWRGYKEDGTTILPQKETKNTNPYTDPFSPTYKITC